MKGMQRLWLIAACGVLFANAWLAALPRSATAANGSVVYTYDPLGRLTTASYDTGVCIIYTYDPAGNRTSQSIRVSGAGSVGYWGCFKWTDGSTWGTGP